MKAKRFTDAQIVADQASDLAMLKDVAGRSWWRRRRAGLPAPTCVPPPV